MMASDIPYSSDNGPPALVAPAGATDCHHHVFGLGYPEAPGLHALPAAYRVRPPDVAAYRLFRRHLGLSRSVVVAPSNYGTDNTCLLDALAALGPDAARGIAIVAADVADDALARLHEAGVRGVRYYLGRDPARDEVVRMAARIAPLGWSLQLTGDRRREVLTEWEDAVADMACPVVLDHFAYAPQPGASASATAATLRRLLAGGRTYVKLSGLYIQSKQGAPAYADADAFASDLVAAAPDRVLWGSDWPHVGATDHVPDGAVLLDKLLAWAPDEATRRKILVDNPSRLYWPELTPAECPPRG